MELTVVSVRNRKPIQQIDKSAESKINLHRYIKLAKLCINRYAFPNAKYSLLANEEAVAYITEQLIIARLKYDKSKMPFTPYIRMNAIFAIKNWVTAHKRKQEKTDIVKNTYVTDKENDHIYTNLVNILPCTKTKTPLEILVCQEESIQPRHTYLSDREQYCLDCKYIHNMTLREIASELHISVQRVSMIIRDATAILKGYV